MYHFNMKSMTRTKQSKQGIQTSSAAKFDYIHRQGVYQSNISNDEEKSRPHSATVQHDYNHRQGAHADRDPCIASFFGNIPSFASKNPRDLFKAIDKHERKNGRLYTYGVVALPREISVSQQQELVQDFMTKLTQEHHYPWSAAIHRGDSKIHGQAHNPHFHFMICERVEDGLDRKGPEIFFKRAMNRTGQGAKKDPAEYGARKSDAIRHKYFVRDARVLWEKICNTHLEKNGFAKRIDHRSYKQQESKKIPRVRLPIHEYLAGINGRKTAAFKLNEQISNYNCEVDNLQVAMNQIPHQTTAVQIPVHNDTSKKTVKPITNKKELTSDSHTVTRSPINSTINNDGDDIDELQRLDDFELQQVDADFLLEQFMRHTQIWSGKEEAVKNMGKIDKQNQEKLQKQHKDREGEIDSMLEKSDPPKFPRFK